MSNGEADDYLAAFTSQYRTRLTRIVPNGQPAQKVVELNAQRVMCRVYPLGGGSSVGVLLPTADALVAIGAVAVPAPIEFKVRDCPDWAVGEWWGSGLDIFGWFVLESIYQG